jgi:hypothetical protein
MDDWKKVVDWAAREQQEEKRKAKEHFTRTLRAWPMVMVAVVPFGALAYFTLDPIRAIIATVGVLVLAVLVAEHVAAH